MTTTRVAERGGVSVGTLYQYYPNKQALLYAVLEVHGAKRRVSKRAHRALTAALAEAAGATMGEMEFVAPMLYSAMAGATRAVLEAGVPAKMMVRLREELLVLCHEYAAKSVRSD